MRERTRKLVAIRFRIKEIVRCHDTFVADGRIEVSGLQRELLRSYFSKCLWDSHPIVFAAIPARVSIRVFLHPERLR